MMSSQILVRWAAPNVTDFRVPSTEDISLQPVSGAQWRARVTTMAWSGKMLRGLAVALIAFLLVPMFPAGTEVAEALTISAAANEPVFGAVTAGIDDPGTMTPTGNGRFTIDDRIFAGKSLSRSVSDDAAGCFTGQFRSVESWSLDSPRMVGNHRSTATIRSDRGTLTLRLRGQMEFPAATGDWQISRGTGDCSDLEGEGTYSATFPASSDGSMRLTFEGQAHS